MITASYYLSQCDNYILYTRMYRNAALRKKLHNYSTFSDNNFNY